MCCLNSAKKSIERLVADLLQRDWLPRDVFSQTLLGGLVEYANAVVDAWSLASLVARPCILAEAGMLRAQEVPSEDLV